MELEGYRNLKPPCNGPATVNAESLICFKGSKWISSMAQVLMAGQFTNKNVKITVDDNFHHA